MKKLIFSLGILSAVIAPAADSYLYWMIDLDSSDNYPALDYARVRYESTGGDGYLTIYDGAFDTAMTVNGESGVGKTDLVVADLMGDGFYASLASIANLASASFIVELYNTEGKFLARSFPNGAYGDMATHIYSSGGIVPTPASPWTAGSFDVPEPSSGLLMLLGMAGLALRRKRVA